MQAIVQDTYGGADVLQLREINKPQIADDEVLVKVQAAGVDRGVWHLMEGLPYLIRAMGYGLRTPKNPVLGMDVAGVVEAVGKNVTRFRPGDEVFGIAQGSFAEYAPAKEKKLAIRPANLSAEQAAALAISGLTALQGLRDQAKVQEGQSVLIVGASGGVGTFAVQIAKTLGAEVTGVCSTAKVDMVRALGADHVIDYKQSDFADGTHRYDVILDIGGNTSLSRLRQALAPKGTLVIVGGEGGGRWTGGIDRQLRAVAMSPFVGQKLGTFVSSENAGDMDVLKQMAESGSISSAIDRTYPLAEAPQAIRDLEAGKVTGKAVISL